MLIEGGVSLDTLFMFYDYFEFIDEDHTQANSLMLHQTGTKAIYSWNIRNWLPHVLLERGQ